MAQSTAWRDETYARIFEEETRGLERRFAANPDISIADLENQLKSLYVSEGNNYDGRGAVGDIMIAATIAAYERFIFERKAAGQAAGAPQS